MKKLFLKAGTLMLVFIMILAGLPAGPAAVFAAEKTGIYEGQPARFSYGSALKTADGQTYGFTGRDLGWMQMYCCNYQTGQSYIGGARELEGPLERYRIRTAGESFVGYCIEHGVMVDESLQLAASDYKNAIISSILGEDVMQNIKLCLFYGRQNGDNIGNLLDEQQDGGLGFRSSDYYGNNASSYTLDDWEMATVMLIRESQQKFRDSRFRLKTGGNGLSYTDGWRGTETAKINKDHYVNPLKGKAAYDIYKYMEQLCCDHLMFSSAVAGMDISSPKNISFGAEDRDAEGNYHKKIAVSAARAYPLKAVNKDNPEEEAEGIEFCLTEEGGKYYYLVTVSPEAFSEGAVFALTKALQCRVPTNDLMVWECETTNGHLQAITTGMADPVQGYFSLSTKAEPVQGEPPEPDYFPAFEFPVSKKDLNPGWDGNVETPMGDAGLDAVYVLYRDGIEVDRVVLDEYGSTAVLSDKPWSSEDDLTCIESGMTDNHLVDSGGEPPEQTDHGCGTAEPTKAEWSGSCTYTICELAPAGRFTEPDAGSGERRYAVSYYAFSEDERLYACETPAWKDIEYTVSYNTVKGTGGGGTAAGGADEIISFDEEVFINDCFRGKITISKSLEREDVFKDSALGGHPDSIKSMWKLHLISGGYEGSPYARFVREDDLPDGTAVYRTVRDQSGSEDLVIGSNGDMIIYDIPYGAYWMEETAADDSSFTLEKFRVDIGEHEGPYTPEDDFDNRYDYNVRNKKITNRIKIIKTDAETGKGVDLPGTKFYIRYKGSPLNTDEENQKLENYNRYLPDAVSITSDGPYTFEADENGEIAVKYELPYGIYEITEWQVPEGYYIHEEGNVYTFTVCSQPVHIDGNFGQLVTYDGRTEAADPLYDSAMYPYTVHYQAAVMANNQVKGRILLEKAGEILTDFVEIKTAGKKVFRPVYEMAGKLKDAVFGIFAAEDIMLSDGNEGPEIYDSAADEKLVIPMSEYTEAGKLYEGGTAAHPSGAVISAVKEKESGAGGEKNHYTRKYISPLQKDTCYSYTHCRSDETFDYRYDIAVKMKYQAGGRNITDVAIKKSTSVRSGELPEIPLTIPSGSVDEGGMPVVLNPLKSYISGNAAPDQQRTSNALSVFEKTETKPGAEGKQKEAVQEYEISFVQEAGNSDGFMVSWDDFSITSKADSEAQKAVTTITGQETVPVIECGAGYTYTAEGCKTVFTAAEPRSPVYFLSADGIRTEMYYAGGYVKALLNIPQSAADTDYEKLMPDMGFDWYSSLTPSQPQAEYEPIRGTRVKATRHESIETGAAESYTVEIVSRQTAEAPFEILFADGYKMSLYTESTEPGTAAGVLVIDGIYKTTRYVSSELVETIRTDENGRAESSQLPLGRYIVRELEAPENYLPDTREFEADLVYKDQFTPMVFADFKAEDYYVPVNIRIKKVFETDFQSGIFSPGKNSVFGIYTAEEISADNGKTVEEDSLIHLFSCGVESITEEIVKLPPGYMYYVKEVFTPGEYELNQTPFYFIVKDGIEAGTVKSAAVAGYYTSYRHDPADDFVSETVSFKGAEAVPVIIDSEISQQEDSDGKILHRAEITDGTAVYELKQNETVSWRTVSGSRVWAGLDEDGRLSLALAGKADGENKPEITLNGTVKVEPEYCRSVTLTRNSSFDKAIQVVINSGENLNPMEILNYRKEVPDDTPVPVIPHIPEVTAPPDIPEKPEEPKPMLPQPEEPEPSHGGYVEKVPETGEPVTIYFWMLTAAAALSALLLIRKKEKEN